MLDEPLAVRCRTRCELFWTREHQESDPVQRRQLEAIRLSVERSLVAAMSGRLPPVEAEPAAIPLSTQRREPAPGAGLLWLAAPVGCAMLALILSM